MTNLSNIFGQVWCGLLAIGIWWMFISNVIEIRRLERALGWRK
jgi:hypothetical protein